MTRIWGALLVAGLSVVQGGCASTAAGSPDPGEAYGEVDLSGYFDGIEPGAATFVLLTPDGEFVRYDPARAARRFLPASTFKIANSLIALETDVVVGPDERFTWDGVVPDDGAFWAEVWSRDHTLRSAFANSVYWVYQEVARRIGEERMQAYLDRFDYGNRDLGGGIDRFWLHGELRISADEQVRFLERMHANAFGLDPRTIDSVEDMMLLDETPTYRLRGKTGTANLTPTRELLWLVGSVERDGRWWFYAMNLEGEDAWERWGGPAARIDLLRGILCELEVLRSGEAPAGSDPG